MWMQVLRGSDQGDFEENDESTYGVPAYYQPMHAEVIGEKPKEHIGKFIWRTNLKTDRFRLQFITKEKKGIVIQSVLCNLTSISDSQKFIGGDQQQEQKAQQEQ